jgi:hypothetical protein
LDVTWSRAWLDGLHKLVDLSLSGPTAHRPELDAPGAATTQAFTDDRNTLGGKKSPGEEDILSADIIQALHDLGAAEKLRLESIPRGANLQEIIDQDFHSVSTISHGLLSIAIGKQKMVHSTHSSDRIIETG